jgi:hypothetical protein
MQHAPDDPNFPPADGQPLISPAPAQAGSRSKLGRPRTCDSAPPATGQRHVRTSMKARPSAQLKSPSITPPMRAAGIPFRPAINDSDKMNCSDPDSRRPLLYAHGEMYGLVTVTQGSPYVSKAVTHLECMPLRANLPKLAQISSKSGFSGDLCA